MGSMPRASATSSTTDSFAKMVCGCPNPRNAPVVWRFVYTPWAMVSTFGIS